MYSTVRGLELYHDRDHDARGFGHGFGGVGGVGKTSSPTIPIQYIIGLQYELTSRTRTFLSPNEGWIANDDGLPRNLGGPEKLHLAAVTCRKEARLVAGGRFPFKLKLRWMPSLSRDSFTPRPTDRPEQQQWPAIQKTHVCCIQSSNNTIGLY